MHLDPTKLPKNLTLPDQSGKGNNGILMNGAKISDHAFLLAQPKSYISTSYKPDLNNNRRYIFMMWFKANQADLNRENTALISNYGSTKTIQYAGMHIFPTGLVRCTEQNSTNVSKYVESKTSVATGKWVHLAMSAIDNALILYINGEKVGSTSRPGGKITSEHALVIGGHHLGRYMKCSIGHVHVFHDVPPNGGVDLKMAMKMMPHPPTR